MQKLLILILCLVCCNNQEPIYKTVDLSKTQKVKVQGNWESKYAMSYLWSGLDGPDNHNSSRIINGNTMLFTPGKTGKYTITVSIENSMGTVLGKEKFYYNVIYDEEQQIRNQSRIDVCNFFSEMQE